MSILTHELHLHLHGCVESEDLWKIGKDGHRDNQDRLAWYSSEFHKAWGYKPDVNAYFNSNDGFELLKRDYELKEYVNFHQFQAKFNLLIALLPITPTDANLIELVLRKQAASGLKYGEYRITIPIGFSERDVHCYLGTISNAFSNMATELAPFVPRAVISITRDNEHTLRIYRWIKDWQDSNPKLTKFLVGIDFGSYEESSPPSTKATFCKTVLEDNMVSPANALAILYHVGESFITIGQEQSIKWVGEAAKMGCHRLGHCLALGARPSKIRNVELSGESEDSLKSLQKKTSEILKEKNTVIESCPTSNLYIAGIQSPNDHPLPWFIEENLNVVVSSDDPGLLGISLSHEERFCIDELAITERQLKKMNELAANSKSEILSGRSQ